MTPSEAHESAWRRDAGHDEMQLAVMRRSRTRWDGVRRVWPGYEDSPASFAAVEAEAYLRGPRGHGFFVDVLIRLGGEAPDPVCATTRPLTAWIALEVKPVIHSCGAVLRQCAVLRANIEEWATHQRGRGIAHTVVRAGDPKAQMLADLGNRSIITWDGTELRWLHPTLGGDAP